jgi:hypothetical protein
MSVINNNIVSEFETTIGVGTINEPIYPCYMYYDYGYFAHIYTNLELGVNRSVWITGLRFHMVGDSVVNKSADNQTLKLGQVNRDEFFINVRNDMTQVPQATEAFITSNISTVKSNFTWTVPEDYNTWLEVLFDTPFQYNPQDANSNLLLLWESRDGSYLSGSSTPYSECSTSSSLYRSYYDYQDNSMPNTTDYGTRDNTGRPNIQLIIKV